MIFPKDKGFKHEAYGAGDVQALLKAQEVRDQKHDKEELEGVITDLNDLSAKYGGIGTATTYNEAMENLEETIQEQSGTLVEKNITENGVYNASSDNADGYSEVTVNVSGERYGATFDENLGSEFNLIEDIKKIVVPDGVSAVSVQVGFYDESSYSSFRSLEEVVLPSSVKELTGFWETPNLSNISLTCSEAWVIRYECFIDSGIKSITLPSTSEGGSIEFSAFERSGLESITIPDNTVLSSETGVGHHFYGCSNLSTATIGKDCILYVDMFEDCENLETIYVNVPEGTEGYEAAPWGAPSTTQVIWTNE